ncbi:glycosyltransferase family 32 protein [Providencia sp. PROV143]|uniref:glycosyltransferase family 32 protein n=1 Tax=Providencia sp. PROV143 TaxID=2949853 RepID=UPI002349843D|nr:glycosyltransferase [Providencia sp. PROV143]
MIPKILHYIWLGPNDIPALEKKCIDTWKLYNPDYTIIKWDESNLNINYPVYQKAYKEKKWAFCADIARLHILFEYGGIYLDTDMEIIKSLDPLLNQSCFLGKEDSTKLNAAIIGCTKNHEFIGDSLQKTLSALQKKYTPIPETLTSLYNEEKYPTVNIYTTNYFYPYNPFKSDIKQLLYQDITSNTYSIHHWSFSWKPSLYERIFNRLKRIISN